MKKIIFFIALFLLLSISVDALGVAPSRNELFYQQENIEDTITVLNTDNKEMEIGIYARGSLKDTIYFDKQTYFIDQFESQKEVSYTLILPQDLEPGPHVLEIFIVETQKGSEQNDVIVQTNLGVIHKLIINVPYPDSYVQSALFIGEAIPKSDVVFTLPLSNLGSKSIEQIYTEIVISDNTGAEIDKITTQSKQLKKEERSKLTATWFANITPGSYHAKATLIYDGKESTLEKIFDVGKPLIEIADIQIGQFKLGSIARYDIVLQSLWNNEITKVKTKTMIRDEDLNIVSEYAASDISLSADESKAVTSYWDTSENDEGIYTLAINLFYLGRVNEKKFELDVKEDEITIINSPFTGHVIKKSTPEPNQNNFFPLFLLVTLIVGCIITGITYSKKKVKSIKSNKNLDSKYRNVQNVSSYQSNPYLSQTSSSNNYGYTETVVNRPQNSTTYQNDPNAQIKQYIVSHVQKGISIPAIKRKLLEHGYTETQVDTLLLDLEDAKQIRI